MTTTINASTSAGLVNTADTSGVLQLQTANTTAVTIDASQNVGIGTASPSRKLTVYATGNSVPAVITNDQTQARLCFKDSVTALDYTVGIGSIGENLASYTGGTERMRIDSSGRVLIGTTSASYGKLVIAGTSADVAMQINDTTYTTAGIGFNGSGSTNGVGAPTQTLYFGQYNGYPIVFTNGNTERMRIDSSGNLLVGTTSVVAGSKTGILFDGNVINGLGLKSSTANTNTNVFVVFKNSADSTAGLIQQNGLTSVSYTTSSDYRLKENIAPMTGALATVSALKPVTYKWKADGSNGQGFIAHELQELVPDCVTGEKDAVETYVDENGNEQTRIKPQGIDTSFLVATLTAAIQEQQALITDLTTRLAALEGAK